MSDDWIPEVAITVALGLDKDIPANVRFEMVQRVARLELFRHIADELVNEVEQMRDDEPS